MFRFQLIKENVFCYVGASGCGKTTITRLINGLIPHFYEGEYSGNVSVYGMNVQSEELYNISKKVGSVFQNPRSQFFCMDTTSEVAFGCENMGLVEITRANFRDIAVAVAD